MDIDEIRKRKTETEGRISRLLEMELDKFQKETGMIVSSIVVEFQTMYEYGSLKPVATIVGRTDIKVEI